jgi:hypothetical protein
MTPKQAADFHRTVKDRLDELQPAYRLTKEERAYFDKVIRSRELDTWNPADLLIVSDLSRCLVQVDLYYSQLIVDGPTVTNFKTGTVTQNPIAAVLASCRGNAATYLRMLGLTSGARALATKDQRGRNNSDRQAQEAIDRAAADNLLA